MKNCKDYIIRELERIGWQIDDWGKVWEYHKEYSRNVAEEQRPIHQSEVIEVCGFLTDLMTAIDKLNEGR